MLSILLLQVEADTSKKSLELLTPKNKNNIIKFQSKKDKKENIIYLPTTYFESSAKKKLPMQNSDIEQNPIINTVDSGYGPSHFIKGLESKHTSYYFEDIPTPHTLNSGTQRLFKRSTMVTKGSGLGGAMMYHMPQERFQSTTGISTNGGIQQRTNFHTEENNLFFTGALAYDDDGGWNKMPSRYRQSDIKDRTTMMEGVFQIGHQDAEQKLTISSASQFFRSAYDDLYGDPASPSEKKYERFFNLFGIAYTRQNWRVFNALHTTKMAFAGTAATRTVTLIAGAEKTETDHKFGCFTEQTNNHKAYHYDIYGGIKVGPFYPSARIIKTERQILCPFEITTQLAKPIQIICGSAYHLPNELERFDPQIGNSNLKPEHNYHCHFVHNWENSKWATEQTLFINHVTDMIEFSGWNNPLQNSGSLNSIGIDQSIGYNGFDRYKIGYAHTYCIIDGSKPVTRRPSWKFLVWQRFYLSEDCFIDLRGNFTGSYLDGERMDFNKHIKMPGVFLLDISTTHILNKNWTILCEVKNITNHHHHEFPRGYLAKGIEAWVRFVYTGG